VRKTLFHNLFLFFIVLSIGTLFINAADSNKKPFGFQPKSISLTEPGKDQLLTGPGKGNSVDKVLQFMQQNSNKLGLNSSDLADVIVTDQYTDSHNNVTHIYLRQRINGIEVLFANAGVHIDKEGRIVSLNTSMISGLNQSANTKSATLTPEQAIVASSQYLGLTISDAPRVLESHAGVAAEIVFSESGISLDPIRVKLVYQPVSQQSVRLAWQVEIYQLDAQHAWNVRVDAITGKILALSDLVNQDQLAPNNKGNIESNANQKPRGFISAPLADDSYNVFAIPKEHPNDGPRTLETNPADPNASPFAWHDTNGAVGAEFTVTRGNNVHAYTDLNADNVADPGSDPDGGAGLIFDFPLDLTLGPSTYRPAAVTNLFYWNNIIHDVTYGYGFDEVSGNFQVNNYGHPGIGNDDVRAEAQDGSGLNNANFFTPVDGARPRMQMFVWIPPGGYVVTVNGGPIAGDYTAAPALFGTQLSESGPLTGDVALVNDGAGPSSTDACEALVGFPAGKIALLDRGNCTFVVKVKNAQNAGAIGAIVANNVAGAPVTMGGADPTITISSLGVTLDDGNLFKANLPFNATLKFIGEAQASRDSDLDSGVIVHEYGHGISNRLTGGPQNVLCLQNAEQMGEGWSDWLALNLTAVASDTKSTSRGIGTYVNFEPPDGNGIRPTPYTTDLSVNPTTYGDIGGLAIPHGVGYAWASMLWELYWNLIDVHGFNPNIYDSYSTGGNNLAVQLVIDGMKLQVCSPGFVDGRDAILQADQNLTGGENQCQIWRSFAKRGLGLSANQGSSNSTIDGTEAFDLPPECVYSFSGFFPPVSNPPALNSKNAGSSVPLKFSLSGNQSLGVLETGYPVSQQIDCNTLTPIGSTEPTESTLGLRYIMELDQYQYDWKTKSAWKNTCRQVIVRLDDLTDHIAYFKFK